MSEDAAVLFANDAFYNAFTTRDLETLGTLWSREAPVICIHPGWAPLEGYDAVMESWASILSGAGSPRISCQDAKTHFLSDDICLVTCYELIGEGALVATNMFVREANAWLLVHHQASPAARPPAPDTGPGRRLQ